MKKGFKLIVPSFLAIIVCVLLLAGSTFALFTSDVTKNIVVGSATVNMTAEYTEFEAYSVVPDDNGTAGTATAYGVTSNYKYSTEYVETVEANSSYIFANKGTAKLTDQNTIELVNVTPGDRITANLKVTNNSNVDIIYRVRLNAISDNGLLDGLTVKAGGETLTGVIKVGEWTPWTTEQTTVQNIALEVFLPVEAGNEYQTKSAILRFTIEAVQANAKADTLLEQVNEYLATHDGNDDGKNDVNNTMYDAIQEVKGNTELAAFDATKYLWSPDTDQFYAPYTVEGLEVHFFKAYSQTEFNELTEQKYSVYATGEWTGSVNITVGFDAGEATGITNINYDRHDATTAQKVVIRTNGGSLTVNAPKDIVHHYGDAETVDVVAVAGQSYHENGLVAFIKISTGRIALEETSSVQQIHLSTTTINSGTQTEDEVFDNIIIAKDENAPMPNLSRDPVEIPKGGKLVVALQSSTEEEADKDYVWLTAIGVYEQVTVSDSATSAGETYASEMTAQSTEEQQKVADQKQAAQQIANNISATIGESQYSVHAQKDEEGEWTYSLKDSQNQTTEYEVTAVEVTTTKESEEVTSTATVTVTNTTVEITTINNNTNDTSAVKQEAIEAVYTNVAYLAPTCTAPGHTAYVKWTENNVEKTRGYEVIPATGHHKSDNPSYQHAFSAAHWQHATQCVVDSAWIVEDCVDLNNDNYCDICNQQMYVLVYTSSDLHTNSKYPSAIWNGAYKLMNNVSLDTMSRIYGDVVIDLNGYTLSNYSINSPADTQFMSYSNANAIYTLTLRDSSISKTGMFMSRFGDTFFDGSGNSGNNRFILNCEDGVTINTSFNYQGTEMDSFAYTGGYFINNASKDIIIRNAHLVIGGIAHVNSSYTITFENCVIESRQSSGFLQSGSGNIVFDGCTITTVMQSSSGNVLDSSDPNVTFINGTTVNGVTK